MSTPLDRINRTPSVTRREAIQRAVGMAGLAAFSRFGINSALAGVIDPAEVKEIVATMPAHPVGFGQPISNRDAWAKVASLPPFQKVVGEAQTRAREPLPESPDELFLDFSKTGNRQHWERVAGMRRGRVDTFALAECLENRGQFLTPLEETIQAICAECTWVMPARDGKLDNFQGRVTEMDLGATMLAWDLATADYLVGEKLSGPTRRLLHENLERRIFTPFRDMVEGRQKEIYWLSVLNNWNAVCLAGVTGSALATLEPREERALFVAAARHYIKSFLRGFTPDGYCGEGLGYWNYGFGYFVMLAEAVRQATDSQVDLLADPWPMAWRSPLRPRAGTMPSPTTTTMWARPWSYRAGRWCCATPVRKSIRHVRSVRGATKVTCSTLLATRCPSLQDNCNRQELRPNGKCCAPTLVRRATSLN
jgi:hypothetical protein